MTYKQKKKFLETYIHSRHRLVGLAFQLEEWETIATKTTKTLSPIIVQSSGNGQKMEDYVIRINQIKEKINDEIIKNQEYQEKVQSVIDRIRDSRKRELLELRYIHGLPVWKIAIEWEKTDRDIYYLLNTAINSIDM